MSYKWKLSFSYIWFKSGKDGELGCRMNSSEITSKGLEGGEKKMHKKKSEENTWLG